MMKDGIREIRRKENMDTQLGLLIPSWVSTCHPKKEEDKLQELLSN